MRWEDERYVRVYTRDTADWLALGWEAQALFVLALRKADRAGLIHTGRDAFKGLAALVGMPLEVVNRCLPALLEDGCIRLTDGPLLVTNFIAAQEATASTGQRKREQRNRDRDKAFASGFVGSFAGADIVASTDRPEPEPSRQMVTPTVTPVCHAKSSRNVTNTPTSVTQLGHSVPCRTVPSRTQETTLSTDPPVDREPLELIPVEPKQPKASAQALAVFEHWRRKMGKNSGTTFEGKRRASVEARLKSFSVEQLCLAVDGCALTPHNMGANDRGKAFNDLELICRDAVNVERFMETARPGKPPPSTGVKLPPGFTKHDENSPPPYARIGVPRV